MDDVCLDPEKTGQPVLVITNPDVQASFSDQLFVDLAGYCFARFAPAISWKAHQGNAGDDTFLADPTIRYSG